MTPAFSSAIISPSAAQSGHHARLEFRPRRINNESVSIVIFVCFAIRPLLSETGSVLKRAQLARRALKKSL
jgi:hypothetical protein